MALTNIVIPVGLAMDAVAVSISSRLKVVELARATMTSALRL